MSDKRKLMAHRCFAEDKTECAASEQIHPRPSNHVTELGLTVIFTLWVIEEHMLNSSVVCDH